MADGSRIEDEIGEASRFLRAVAAPLAVVVALAAEPGCGPAEVGAIDMAKSKAIAAEKGIGPGGGGPRPDSGKPKKNASARPSQAGTAPGAPAAK